MEEASKQLFKEIKKVYTEKGFITDELLSALDFLFQGPLLHALDLVDKGNISLLLSPSGRCIYQVIGSTGTPYMCFTTCNYCSCPAFKFSVISREEAHWCKHLLAIKLSEAMDTVHKKQITNEDMKNILINLD